MSVLIPILLPHVLNDNGEVVHRHEVPGPSSSRKSEFLLQLGLYILGRSLDLTNRGKARMGGSTDKVDGFEYFRRDLIITRPTLPTSAEVYPFLKHAIYGRFLLPSTAAAHDTLHKVLCRLPLVRCGPRVSPLISISSRQSTINRHSSGSLRHEERHEDSLIPRDQHAGVICFSTRFEVLGDSIIVQIGLHQGL